MHVTFPSPCYQTSSNHQTDKTLKSAQRRTAVAPAPWCVLVHGAMDAGRWTLAQVDEVRSGRQDLLPFAATASIPPRKYSIAIFDFSSTARHGSRP